MGVLSNDPMIGIADAVAYCFSQPGYAFVEDDKLEALADTLRSFLKTAGIPVNDIVRGSQPENATPSRGLDGPV